MSTNRNNLILAALEIVDDFDRYGEVLQAADDGEYDQNTAIEKLRAAVIAEQEANNDIVIEVKGGCVIDVYREDGDKLDFQYIVDDRDADEEEG